MSKEPSKPGTRRCMKCGWFFVSPDVLRVGRCQDCTRGEDSYSPREARMAQVHGAIRCHFQRDTS